MPDMDFKKMGGIALMLSISLGMINASGATVSGTITSKAGSPLAGIEVSLTALGLQTTTNQQGYYSFNYSAVGLVKEQGLRDHSGFVSFKHDLLTLKIFDASDVSARLFDLRGRLVANLYSGRLSAGTTNIPLSGSAPGLYLMQISIAGRVSNFKVASDGRSISELPGKESSAHDLAAVNSASNDGLWIVAQGSGYSPHVALVGGSSSTINFTLEPISAPDFGPNVYVYDPTMNMAGIQSQLNSIYTVSDSNQFGTSRYAYLFKPGTYDLDVKVGFYTSVLGLGESPDNVTINGAVRVMGDWMPEHNSTCNFWRACENLSILPNLGGTNINTWAVSQATAYRRVHVKGQVQLFDMNGYVAGWASGGFLADTKIDAQINSGSQQQWLSRNCEWGSWVAGVWNMVFVGDPKPPTGTWPAQPFTVVDSTPIMREKPFLFLDNNNYSIKVPLLHTNGTSGISWGNGVSAGTVLALDKFYLAHSDRDSAASINAALAQGLNVLLSPGIYHLDKSINITKAGTIMMGIGYPTLLSDSGTAAIKVSDVDGVTLGGMLVEAGMSNSPTLVQIGESGSHVDHSSNPTFMYDIFCRVGGVFPGKTSCCMTINSSNVVGDNFWLWRADHGAGAAWDQNTNDNGIIVNGDNVTMYGLFVEHGEKYQTLWNGNYGRVYMYQSELPYDPPNQASWQHDGVNGYASYKVADNVTNHEAWGLGIYCVFYDAPVICDRAIETPTGQGIKMHHMVTRWLTGLSGSAIEHVINNLGLPVYDTAHAGATVDSLN